MEDNQPAKSSALKALAASFRWNSETKRNGLWAVAVVMLVVGWRLGVLAKTSGIRAECRELVSIRSLVRDPVPNKAGDKVLFVQTTPNGLGVCLKDLKTGKTQTIQEMPETRMLGKLYLLEWSPDDMVLAYTRPKVGNKQAIVLCSGSLGKEFAAPEAKGVVNEFRWMSPSSFAYLNDANTVCVVKRGAKGHWKKRNDYGPRTSPEMTQLEALGANKVAWVQDGAIWQWEPSRGQPTELWRPAPGHRLVGYFGELETKDLLVTTANDAENSYELLNLDPDSGAAKKIEVISQKLLSGETEPPQTLPEKSIFRAKWINEGKGYAFQCRDHWGDSLLLHPAAGASFISLFSEGQVMDFRSARGRVFLYGSQKDEPRGIWDYNLASNSCKCVVTPMDKPFSFAGGVSHTWGVMTNEGRQVIFHLWRPLVLTPGKKYPLILGQTRYMWTPYPYAAARAGYFFVNIHRDNPQGIVNWESDILAADQYFRGTNIDQGRVYLFGLSAETSMISQMLAERPELWKGALLLTPTGLPDLSRIRLRTMMIAAGGNDAGNTNRLPAYTTKAAKRGISIRMTMNPKSMHSVFAKEAELNLVEATASYLRSEN